MATLEVGRNYRPVLFLSGSVPDIQFSWFIGEINVFYFEIDGGDLRIFFRQKLSLSESPEERRFTYITVPNNDNFISFLVLVSS